MSPNNIIESEEARRFTIMSDNLIMWIQEKARRLAVESMESFTMQWNMEMTI